MKPEEELRKAKDCIIAIRNELGLPQHVSIVDEIRRLKSNVNVSGLEWWMIPTAENKLAVMRPEIAAMRNLIEHMRAELSRVGITVVEPPVKFPWNWEGTTP